MAPRRVLPRARGYTATEEEKATYQQGSSPRARVHLGKTRLIRQKSGFFPARAGTPLLNGSVGMGCAEPPLGPAFL